MTTANVLPLHQDVVRFRWWLQSGRGAVARHFPLGNPIDPAVRERLDHLIYSRRLSSDPPAVNERTGFVTLPPMPLERAYRIVDFLVYGGDEISFDATAGTALALLAPAGDPFVGAAWSQNLRAGKWDVILNRRLRHDDRARWALAVALVPFRGQVIDVATIVTMVRQVRDTLGAGGLEHEYIDEIMGMVVVTARVAIADHLNGDPQRWNQQLVALLKEQNDPGCLYEVAMALEDRNPILPEGLGFDNPDQGVDQARRLREGLEQHLGPDRGLRMFETAMQDTARRWGGHLYWSSLPPGFTPDPRVLQFLPEMSGRLLAQVATGYGHAAAAQVCLDMGPPNTTLAPNYQFAYSHRFGDPRRGLLMFADGLPALRQLPLTARAAFFFIAEAWMEMEDALRQDYERNGQLRLPDPATHEYFELMKAQYAQPSGPATPPLTGGPDQGIE